MISRVISFKYHRWFVIAGLCVAVIFCLNIFTSDSTNVSNDKHLMHTQLLKIIYDPANDTLVDLHDFRYVMNNVSLCSFSMTDPEKNQLAIAVMIHSGRSNFRARHAIRNTWGSVKKWQNWYFHLLFLLGSGGDIDAALESQLQEESKRFGDIIMGNFIDTYRNLTYKHLMGYKWVSTFCPSARFILKADDDIYADIFQVVEILVPELIASGKTYACENMAGNNPFREPNKKWYVSKEEFPEDKYPPFCSGSAYLMTADGAAKIYSVCNKTKYLWVDDVFVTGVLRERYDLLSTNTNKESLQILTIYNQHHLGNKVDIIKWCKRDLTSEQLNSTFILLDNKDNNAKRGNQFVSDMYCLWNKIRLMRFAMTSMLN